MGLLTNGQWQDLWYDTGEDGQFHREVAQRRNWITATGEAGPSGQGGFKAEANRYHLYISLACPWAHRTLIMRTLKDLQPIIDVSCVSWLLGPNGWTFDRETGSCGDRLDQQQFLYQRYLADDSHYTGRVTVPVLWDKQKNCIVSNESAEIIRMFNQAFDHLTGNRLDLYPSHLRQEIDWWNERIYPRINNGVYRAGFATSQPAYEEAFANLFDELAFLEQHLSEHRYISGDHLTEADIRLFTTLIRFDVVYHGHFKCNWKRIADYPALQGWLREIYQWPGIARTVNFTHIQYHYYQSHKHINPNGIVPNGPKLTLDQAHGREYLSAHGIWIKED